MGLAGGSKFTNPHSGTPAIAFGFQVFFLYRTSLPTMVFTIQISVSTFYLVINEYVSFICFPPPPPRWLSGKESACDSEDAGDPGLIPGLGRSSGAGTSNPFLCSCLENPMDRGNWGLQSMVSKRVRHNVASEQ